MDMKTPSINLTYSKDSEKYLKEILNGIEEEGIPCSINEGLNFNSIEKSFENSQNSRLSVGIAINLKDIVVHFSKLEKDKPLIILDTKDVDKDALRICGTNAARLIKGIPLKNLY